MKEVTVMKNLAFTKKIYFLTDWRIIFLLFTVMAVVSPSPACAENIDPLNNDSQWSYGENTGWFNFEPGLGPGVTVTGTAVTGYVWQENVGWINLSPASYGGVVNTNGVLSGYGWGENVGWISFSCENTGSCGTVDYGVTIDTQGIFDGWAWGENIGWINFALVSQPDYQVQTSWDQTTIRAVETDESWLLIAPVDDLSGQPINNVGLTWEANNTGWNTKFTYGTSSWGTPVSYGDIWGHGYSAYWAPGHASPCYLRKIVNLPAVQQAFLSGGDDDDIQIYINGTLVFDDHKGTTAGFGPIDVTRYLVPGSNLIAAKAHDSFGGDDGYYFKIAWTAPPPPNPTTTTVQPTTTTSVITTTTTVPPTLIELQSFTATAYNEAIILKWQTASEIDNTGFNILRAEAEDGDYVQINYAIIPAEGSATEGASYKFIDSGLKNRKTYYYLLEDLNKWGTATKHVPVSATPRWFRLLLGNIK